MKKLLAALLLWVCALPALAQVPVVSPTVQEPHIGFIRKGPCGNGAGDDCGSNPPTWHITPAMCGVLFSTSNARNADGTQSTKGVRFTLPTVAEFSAAGYSPTGAAGSDGFTNRQGQCQLHFVQGLPGPENYLRIGIDGVAGTDKVTFIYQGTFHDLNYGDVEFPFIGSAVLSIVWNGTSWLATGGTPSMMEQIGYGQMAAHGQGRLFRVTADPSWWTVGTQVGNLAYCPVNGRGTATPSNGGIALQLIPINCVFHVPAATSAGEFIGLRHFGSFNVTAISQGTAYGSGTAPNGDAYAAGNYVRLTVSSSTNMQSGNTVEIHNIRTSLGTVINGKWIMQLISATEIELHQSVREAENMNDASAVGPPSAFVTGDTLTATATAGGYMALAATSAAGTPKVTNPANGVEEDAGRLRAIVGFARRETGTYTDSTTQRHIVSLFNPVEKKCQSVLSTDRTTTSLTFVEINSEIRCEFAYLKGSSTQALSLGDQGRPVRYVLTIGAGNNTASDGCEFAIGFNGTTPEAEIAGFVNTAAAGGGRQTVSLAGSKTGLAEQSAVHYATLLARAVTGGTCTVYSANTTLTLYLWQ